MNSLLRLTDEELVARCNSDPSVTGVCLNDKFWEQRYKLNFPLYAQFYNGKTTWAKYYIDTKRLLEQPLSNALANKYVGRSDLLQILASFGYYPSRYTGYGSHHDSAKTHSPSDFCTTGKNHNLPVSSATNSATDSVASSMNALAASHGITPFTVANSPSQGVQGVQGTQGAQDGGRGFGGGLLVGSLVGFGLGAAVGSAAANNRRDAGYTHTPNDYASTSVCTKGCGSSKYN